MLFLHKNKITNKKITNSFVEIHTKIKEKKRIEERQKMTIITEYHRK